MAEMPLPRRAVPHGGRLRAAAHHWRIPLQHWLDLSTGINPQGWPVPELPAAVWQRLPEDEDGLVMAMTAYFGTAPILPVAGSQAAIQSLPRLWATSRIGIVSPTYAEHARAWQRAGHVVREIAFEDVDRHLPVLDVLLVVNPDNPTGALRPRVELEAWRETLAARGGCLIVDEAFIDATPGHSLLADAGRPGLVLLRSLGKFWGLAGVRCGFVLGPQTIIAALGEEIGPWALSHPARWVAQRALADVAWQAATRERLQRDSARLADLLAANGLASPSGCALFRWLPSSRAREFHAHCAQHAILVRHFPELPHTGVRIGLPPDEAGWDKLAAALQGWQP